MSSDVRTYNINRMSGVAKQKMWFAIKRDHPALAAFLQSESYRLMHKALGAEATVRIDGKGRVIPQRATRRD